MNVEAVKPNYEGMCETLGFENDMLKKEFAEATNRANVERKEMQLEIARLNGIIEGYEKAMKMYWK